jgi:hypothetical protein
MSYHSFLSLGGVADVEIKNNLLIDHVALGADTAAVRQAEFDDAGEIDPNNGLPKITWITCTPPGVGDVWSVHQNYYSVSDSCYAMYTTTAPPLGPPLYRNEGPPVPNSVGVLLGADAFIKTCIKPVAVPQLMTEFIRWLYIVRAGPDSGGGKGKGGNLDPFWLRGYVSKGVYRFDYHRQSLAYYKNTLNCNYYAGYNLATAGTDGQIIGDTRWSYLGGCGGDNTIIAMAKGWNLVSCPRVQASYAATSVFPGALGSLFKYDPNIGDYAEAPDVALGMGVWVYYTGATAISVIGSVPVSIVIACKKGWNIIGGRETPVAPGSLTVDAGAILGSLFKYDPAIGDYAEITGNIEPGMGAWVYVTANCNLTVP